MNLSEFVWQIVRHSNGMSHSEVVKEVLKSGYIHHGSQPLSQPLSQAVHVTLRKLVSEKTISRTEEKLERKYFKQKMDSKQMDCVCS